MNQSIRIKILLQVIFPLLLSLAVIIMGYYLVTPATKKMLINERKSMIREMVDNTCTILQKYHQRIGNGELTDEQAKAEFLENIKIQLRTPSHSDYYWIEDLQGNFIYHPYQNQNFTTKRALQLTKIRNEVLQLALLKKEGFISYKWFSISDTNKFYQKEAFVKLYKPWGWVICKGFMVNDIKDEINQLSKKVIFILSIFLAIIFIIITFIIWHNYHNLKRINQANQDLRKSESRFRGFVEHIDNGLLILENDIPVFMNQQFVRIFNFSSSDPMDFNLEDYLANWEKERYRIATQNPTTLGKVEFSTWITLPDGSEKFVKVDFIITEEPNIAYKYLIIQDLTEERNILTTNDILSENIEKSPYAILITDLNGCIEYVNPEFEKTTGYQFEEIKGKKPSILKSGKMQPVIYKDLWDTLYKGDVWYGEMLNKKKDGSLFWEATTIFPIRNRQNEIIKYSSVKKDITWKKQTEQELLAAKEKADENEKLKTALLSNISHEVRTPLNAIQGFSQIIKQKLSEDEESLELFRIMEENCQALVHLFDDMIDYAVIESGGLVLNREEVKFKDLIYKAISKYNTKLLINDKAIGIEIAGDSNFDTMTIYTDPRRFIQVFDELISNAIKYTHNGSIVISYTIDYESITFHINDSGVGIAPAEQQKIFDTFYHGKNLEIGLHHGVGLGLKIAGKLIENMGGNLTLESEEGIGSTFSFTLPAVDIRNYKLKEHTTIDYRKNIQDLTILVGEPNDENFRYFDSILSVNNVIIRAKTGIELIKIVQNNTRLPDIILTELLMPEMDGVSATRIIKNIHPEIPVVGISKLGTKINHISQDLYQTILFKPVKTQIMFEQLNQILVQKAYK